MCNSSSYPPVKGCESRTVGNDSNRVKADYLGMPYGTATARLRKSLLFSFAQRLHEDICFKCSQQIQTVEEFSIEHKKPWLYNSVELFFNLDNIAFSHLICNRPDRPYKGPSKLRKMGKEGTAWCSRHQQFLPISSFGKNSKRWNGLHAFCKECHLKTK